MGFLDSLLNAASKMADAGERYVDRQADEYSRGYNRGSQSASDMSDEELRSELRRAKSNGVSGMNNAGKTRAMLDEYERRNNK